ncbi:hypothetical protein [Salipiger sp.]|uniref:hypothetical protein n=1 Tax=Salipiger sp. TaxID=2078585 RepID=UPI003A985CFB
MFEDAPRVVRFHLYDDLKARVAAGRHPLLCLLREVLEAQGLAVELCGDSPAELTGARLFPGFSVVRMVAPPNRRGVTFRRTYVEPFHDIEPVAERWNWAVARAVFDPGAIKEEKAARFLANLRKDRFAAMAAALGRDGHVYVPLQGRLTERRSFQSDSPLGMIAAVLAHDPVRPVIAALHPREHYGAGEIAALEEMVRANPRLHLARGEMARLLPRCDYVVTQNSGAAFAGQVLGKAVVYFAGSDVDHLSLRVADLGAREAIRRAPEHAPPDLAAYIWWRLRGQSIHTGREDAPERILAALVRAGWPLA